MNLTDFYISRAESQADHNVYDPWYGYHNTVMMGVSLAAHIRAGGREPPASACPSFFKKFLRFEMQTSFELIGV